MAVKRIKGERHIARQLRHFQRTIPEAVMMGVFALGEAILADATVRVPVDTGRLRTTGYCAPPSKVGRGQVEVGFGTEYAAAVHERTDVSHDVGEAKFLEKAVMNQFPRSMRIIAASAERYAKRGGTPSGPWPEGTEK